jgi:hypothetical protein
MAGRHVPPRAVSLECEAVYISVREAARILGVSERSVYGYLAQGKLSKKYIDERITLVEAEVLAFERRAPGRTRKSPPLWHLPPGQNPLFLTTIMVSLLPGCDALLEEKLTEFRAQGKHEITGTCARSISRSLHFPDRLTILLFWYDESRPSDEQREQEIAALGADLALVCAWEAALIIEAQSFIHANACSSSCENSLPPIPFN